MSLSGFSRIFKVRLIEIKGGDYPILVCASPIDDLSQLPCQTSKVTSELRHFRCSRNYPGSTRRLVMHLTAGSVGLCRRLSACRRLCALTGCAKFGKMFVSSSEIVVTPTPFV